ncbi:uncharacterized protein VTP21DRAFT_9597 [Calcarisporiella thermophila]|uniref:uncharacterized protein n=1 Tax=Calcarisporiella thermophila TaxID=911321 RepID=UPI003744415F
MTFAAVVKKAAVQSATKLRPTKAAMTLTPAAVERLKQLSTLEGQSKMIRVGLRTKGCSGNQYHLEFTDKKNKFDEEVTQDGVTVLIDSKALFSVLGSEMDYVEDKLATQFVFHNPNVKETCGCGMSFMT